MLGLAAKYRLSDVWKGLSVIRDSVWSCFVQKAQLYSFFLYCILNQSFYCFMCLLYICTRALHTVRIQ